MFFRQLVRMSNWSVRTKLLVVMAPLALAVLGLAVYQIGTQETVRNELVSAQRALEVGTRAWEVADALQEERAAVVSFIHSGRRDSAPFVEAVQRVDTTVAALRVAVGREYLAPAARAGADKALTELDGLDALRRAVQQTRLPDVSAHTRYSQILDVLVRTGRGTADSVSTLRVGSDVAAIQSLGAAQEHLATQNAILLAAAYTRDLPPQQANQLRAAQSRFDAAVGEFTAAADPELQQRYQDTVSGADVDERNRLIQLALVQSSTNRPVTVAAADAARTGEATTKRVAAVRDYITADAVAMTDADAAAARTSTVAVSAMIFAVLLVALAVAILVANSLLRPLRVLRRTALYVAKHALPKAINDILADPKPLIAAKTAIATVPIHSNEEIGQVARAFDDVNRAAGEQAARQALLRDSVTVMLVDLGRRSQGLVERQIAVIDKLERNEEDPDQLAELFELDHLATRMRRNSENILVLSGSELSRRPAHPVQLHEVFGTAVSEAEQFARVTPDARCEVAVLGHVVKDLAHLLAELLDNATTFSDPTTKVTLRGALARNQHLMIEVSDQGIGMPEDQIEEINRQLADPPDISTRISGRLGLRVVALLARRHGIAVSLRANGLGGITAKVVVPAGLFVVAQPPALIIDAPPADPPPEPTVAAAEVDLFQPHGEDAGATSPVDLAATLPAGGGVTHANEREFSTERFPQIDAVMSRWFVPPGSAAARAGRPSGTNMEQAENTAAPFEANDGNRRAVSAQRRPSRPSLATAAWTSPADAGWKAANAILTAATPDLKTAADLPKRVPNACLLPGSPLAAKTPPTTGTDPERIRQRLTSFQQAVHRARQEPATEVTD